MKRQAVLLLGLLLSGCGFKFPTLPGLPTEKELEGMLPKLPSGRTVLIEISNARLEIDPATSDAISALGSCTDLVTYCASDGNDLDDCVDSVRECATAEPWKEANECCPAGCKAAYQRERKTAEPIDAFEAAFFLKADCFPGLAAALGASHEADPGARPPARRRARRGVGVHLLHLRQRGPRALAVHVDGQVVLLPAGGTAHGARALDWRARRAPRPVGAHA